MEKEIITLNRNYAYFNALVHAACLFTTMATDQYGIFVHPQHKTLLAHTTLTVWNDLVQYSNHINEIWARKI